MNIDGKELWNESKAKMPPHQRMVTESLIDLAGSHNICWICGDDDNLFQMKAKSEDSEEIQVILCEDCLHIQKSMGAAIVEESPIKE